MAALDAIDLKIYSKGKKVEIVGLNQATQAWHTTLTGQLGSAH